MTAATEISVASTAGLVTPDAPATRTRRRGLRLALRVVGPLVLLLAWVTGSATGLLSPTLLASPGQVLAAVGELWTSGQLGDALEVSLARAGAGLAIGVLVGLSLGVLTGFSRLGEELLDSSVQLLRTVPFLSLVPLFMVWFGIGETARVVLIAVATSFPMYVSTSGGVRNADRGLLEAMRTFGMGRLALVREVVLPGALPSLLSGLRLSMTLSVIALIAAEEINSTAGIGYLMSTAQEYSRTDVLTVCILIYAVIGLLADGAVRLLERLVMPWRTVGRGAR
ncbi:ABC transporter permease [Amycolatopsis sp. VS8301801F10]|uniref:ABC transporter permease n=1 Tax=Amycolatopsis sp. VS8301801F10 TaxID=2652442 RepID=UPI0038FD1337